MNLTLEQLMEMLGRQAAPMPAVNPTGIPSAPTSGLLADAITLPPVEVMPDNMDVDMSPEMMKYLQNSTKEQQEKIYEQQRMKNQTPIVDPILNLIDKLMQGGR